MAKTAISDWATAAGDNTDVAGINIDEGMAPSDVNNALRAVMAQLRTWYDQEHVGQVRWFGHDGPAGNWLACDGAAYDSVTDGEYAALYAKIGTTFGGTGATDFKVPDLRGRAAMGAGQGDTAEGGGTGTSRALGAKVGQESDAHSHSVPDHTHPFSGTTAGSGTLTTGQGSSSTKNGPPQETDAAARSDHTHAIASHAHGFGGATAAGGSGDSGSTAVDRVSPSLVLKACIGY